MSVKTYFKTIIYSDPGVGKTVLFGSVVDVPEMLPAFMIDFEGNTDSIESKCHYLENFDDPLDINKLNVYRIKPREGVSRTSRITGVEKYEKVLNFLIDRRPCESVFIDSLSEIDHWNIKYLVKSRPQIKRQHPDVPDFPDYRANYEMTLDYLHVLRDTDMHIFASCHTYLDDEDKVIRPRITGQLRTAVPGIFKQVGIMTVSNKTRVLRFQPYGAYHAKDCTEGGLMGDKIEDPTMRKLYNLRFGVQ